MKYTVALIYFFILIEIYFRQIFKFTNKIYLGRNYNKFSTRIGLVLKFFSNFSSK